MPCAFFSRIAEKLMIAGCETTGVNFCAGDGLFWRGPRTVNYRGRLEDWPAFFTAFLEERAITDVVLLGEQRSYHKPAIKIAQDLGLRVMVTDFGYLRPDWITLERDGMNGSSRFPRDPRRILELAAGAGEIDFTRQFKDSSWNMAVRDLIYNMANLLFGWLYPHYQRSDKRPPTVKYTLSSARRMLRARLDADTTRTRLATLLGSDAKFYLFPLQLEHDFQIVAYSPHKLDEAVRMIISSFAAHAPAETRLVVKVHPWDPGLRNWRQLIRDCALEHGVEERVDYFDGGDLDRMTGAALGMVTVNSTSGLRAVQLRCPVKLLGQAVYDVPGVTAQMPLDAFWKECPQPDPDLTQALLRAMASTTQIRGVFFNEPGLTAAVTAAVRRLLRED